MRLKILVFTTVFPNQKQPNLGVFVRERMSRVAKHCQIKVIAPVPYFPLAGLFKEKYRKRIPLIEDQQGIEIFHPKFFLIPGIMKFLMVFFSICPQRDLLKRFKKLLILT